MNGTSQGGRLPANHRLVAEVLREQPPGRHASAAEVFARARQRKPSLGYSTVYRALDRLCRLGLVAELRLPGSTAAVYETARPDHAHFVCRHCGSIEDVDVAFAAGPVVAEIGGRGGEVEDVVVTARGRCAACRAARVGTGLAAAGAPNA